MALVGAGCSGTRPAVVEPGPAAPPPLPPPPAYGAVPGGDLNALFSDRFDDTRAIEVLYVTNRIRGERAGCDDEAFGVNPSDSLSFGVCRLNVPKNHAVGTLETAPNPRSDPHSYYRVLSHDGLSRAAFSSRISAGRQDVLVFVHGFNVKFDQAVLRASQIAYDLKFQGDVILFSWPAGAPPGIFSGARLERTYEHNTRNAASSIGQAVVFFRELERTGRTVHVIVHSMGHQVVVPALVAAASNSLSIGELVLNAPDFPVEDFRTAAPILAGAARRVTVYCSYNDNAIAASEYRNDGRRMGACEQADGVDVINVGEIDAPTLGIGGLGHGYYASRPILTDIYQVLLGIDASNRLFVRKAEINSTQDFFLRK